MLASYLLTVGIEPTSRKSPCRQRSSDSAPLLHEATLELEHMLQPQSTLVPHGIEVGSGSSWNFGSLRKGIIHKNGCFHKSLLALLGAQKAMELGDNKTMDREDALVPVSFDQCKHQKIFCGCAQSRA